MKATAAAYDRARSKAEAIDLLAEHGDEAKLLAGGQSLIPMMNLRLAQPTRLIDISFCGDLASITVEGTKVRCGSAVRHIRFERAVEPALADCAAMSQAAQHIGHAPIRARGTLGGSLAHADSTSEWCLMMLALDGCLELESALGVRSVVADHFFQGVFTTALQEDELLVSVAFPASTRGTSLVEHARRRGDFAIVAAATRLQVDERLRVDTARIALGGVDSRPIRMPEVERTLLGLDLSDPRDTSRAFEEVAHLCASKIQAMDDAHVSARYRRRLTYSLVRHALIKSSYDWQVPSVRS